MDEHQIEASLEWLGLLAADEDSLAAVRYLEQVTDSLLATQFPGTSDLYLAGTLAQRMGQHAMAVEHFERLEGCPLSLGRVGFGWGLQALSRLQRAKSLELRAVTSLSRLLHQQGEKDEAPQMLAEIYGRFTEGFNTADLKEAKALLDELS